MTCVCVFACILQSSSFPPYTHIFLRVQRTGIHGRSFVVSSLPGNPPGLVEGRGSIGGVTPRPITHVLLSK